MGIPVYCLQGSGGGVLIDEKYKLSNSFLTNKDIHNIIFALTTFDEITGAQNKDEILMKLCLIEPDLTNIVENDAKNYFVVDLVDEKVNLHEDISKIINYCLDEEVYIELYLNSEKLVVAPISYVLKRDGIYLYCYDHDYKLIKIDNIKKCKVTTIDFIRNFQPYNKNQKYKG